MAVGVNRDASLFCRAPDSDLVARHGGVAAQAHVDSAVRRSGPRGAGRAEHSPRHNKSGHGRSSCRSVSGRGSRHTETAELMLRRHDRNRDRHMDDRHDCRDTVPACVLSTVWGTASMRNRQVRIGAVLAPRKQQTTTHHTGQQSACCRPAEQQHHLSIGSPIGTPCLPGPTVAKPTRQASSAG